MIRRLGKNLGVLDPDAVPVPDASRSLERDGYAHLHGVFTSDEVARMQAEIDAAFTQYAPERSRTDKDEFRYEMLNRSGACQAAIAHPTVLGAVEPLLGDDCHVIANTAWRNPPEFAGGPWHCDAGPHVPRPEGVPWDDRVPYPVFAVGAHFLLADCTATDGPTAVVPGSHRSGRLAPFDRLFDTDLSYDDRPPVLLEGVAGDVLLFVSDVWHRGTAAGPGGRGRSFLQVHYGRRDIAQRIRTTDVANQLSPEAVARATTERERSLVGLHDPFFYDG
jgi:ectoine hydroxylase-related dioxygenase (phytanoyl-CoA dioxygenase family)